MKKGNTMAISLKSTDGKAPDSVKTESHQSANPDYRIRGPPNSLIKKSIDVKAITPVGRGEKFCPILKLI